MNPSRIQLSEKVLKTLPRGDGTANRYYDTEAPGLVFWAIKVGMIERLTGKRAECGFDFEARLQGHGALLEGAGGTTAEASQSPNYNRILVCLGVCPKLDLEQARKQANAVHAYFKQCYSNLEV